MIKILIYLTFLLKTFYIFKYNIYTRDITYINKGDLIWAYLANQKQNHFYKKSKIDVLSIALKQ